MRRHRKLAGTARSSIWSLACGLALASHFHDTASTPQPCCYGVVMCGWAVDICWFRFVDVVGWMMGAGFDAGRQETFTRAT